MYDLSYPCHSAHRRAFWPFSGFISSNHPKEESKKTSSGHIARFKCFKVSRSNLKANTLNTLHTINSNHVSLCKIFQRWGTYCFKKLLSNSTVIEFCRRAPVGFGPQFGGFEMNGSTEVEKMNCPEQFVWVDLHKVTWGEGYELCRKP